MTYRFDHLHLVCRDLEKMIDFFVGSLGAALIVRKKFGTADGASLDLHGTTINLRVSREDEQLAGDAFEPRYGYDHIGLAVEDVDAACRDLTDRGYSFFMPPTDIPGQRIAFFKGPDGITVELNQHRD